MHRSNPQICVFDRLEKRTFKTGIVNVAVERDFNRIDVDGLPSDAFENAMSHFESELAVSLERINAARSLADQNDRAYLLNLVCQTAIRNPQIRESVRKGHEQTAKMVMDLVLQSPARYAQQKEAMKAAGAEVSHDVSYEEMKAFFESGKYKIELATGYHVHQEIRLFDKTLPLLFKRGWQLLRAPKTSAGFITSDHPSCLMWSTPRQRGGLYGPGLGLTGTELIFPVSPRLAVIGSFEIPDGEIDVGDEIVTSINGAVITMTERQVYSRDHNFTYSMKPDEPPRKASRLISDRRFVEREEEVQETVVS
jgi:hypothetical protein